MHQITPESQRQWTLNTEMQQRAKYERCVSIYECVCPLNNHRIGGMAVIRKWRKNSIVGALFVCRAAADTHLWMFCGVWWCCLLKCIFFLCRVIVVVVAFCVFFVAASFFCFVLASRLMLYCFNGLYQCSLFSVLHFFRFLCSFISYCLFRTLLTSDF